ncbi:hypothetical protein C8R43DRAFT_952805 [Mycena crocata]|nr:hypothetical protein C8R43DRAFT_952805 [Mycena crocata]
MLPARLSGIQDQSHGMSDKGLDARFHRQDTRSPRQQVSLFSILWQIDLPVKKNHLASFQSFPNLIRADGELEPHIEQLRAYMETCPVSTHDNVGFMIRERTQFDLSPLSYSAMLPPIALRWVQARPEVVSIEKQCAPKGPDVLASSFRAQAESPAQTHSVRSEMREGEELEGLRKAQGKALRVGLSAIIGSMVPARISVFCGRF